MTTMLLFHEDSEIKEEGRLYINKSISNKHKKIWDSNKKKIKKAFLGKNTINDFKKTTFSEEGKAKQGYLTYNMFFFTLGPHHWNKLPKDLIPNIDRYKVISGLNNFRIFEDYNNVVIIISISI